MKTRIGVLCGCAALLLLAALLPAKPGVVRTRDGNAYEGDVTEAGTTVTVTRRNVPIVIQRGDVESIEYLGTFEEQYAQRMAKLDEKDAVGRIAIGRWAFEHGHYDKAREALEQAVTLEPNNRDANLLLESVRVQIRMERAKRAATLPTTARVATTAPATAPSAPNQPDPRHLLTADDINAIRQFELKPADTHVRINFARDVKKRFAAAQNIRIQELNARTPFDQLQAILRDGTPDMKRDVRIVSDPSSLLEYRRSVQPAVLQSCATSGCHGAAGAGGLTLFSPADNEAVTYTNFFLMNTFSSSRKDAAGQQGPFGAGERRLIDRLEPNRSLLLQYAVPANISDDDHPQVNGYRPLFRSRDDSGYRRLADWIGQSLRLTQPDYGIRYTPPPRAGAARAGDVPATQDAPPATPPAATAPAMRPKA